MWKRPKIVERKLNKYHWLVFHKDKLRLGKNTDIGAFCLLDASCGIDIEDYVQVGSHCSIYSRTSIDNKRGKVVLKENCCVGSHSVVMPGVIVGRGAVVGALSFVNRDIPEGEVWAGSPVRKIK